jgi:hypothetical protein
VAKLLLEFRDNRTSHEDIHLCLDGYSRVADSYYLALDSFMDPEDESVDKTRRVFARLLNLWVEALGQATREQPAYLPYDFSDQYTGCLRCRPDGEALEVTAGWSRREGYCVSPSDPGDYFFGLTDFNPDLSSTTRLRREEFLRQLDESIREANLQITEKPDLSERGSVD